MDSTYLKCSPNVARAKETAISQVVYGHFVDLIDVFYGKASLLKNSFDWSRESLLFCFGW